MAKNKTTGFGIVYSTDPDFKLPEESAAAETLAPALQKIKVSFELYFKYIIITNSI